MKRVFRFPIYPWLPLGAGFLGLLLRIWLFATGLDEKNLLSVTHPAHILILVLTVAVVVLLFCFPPNPGYVVRKNPPASGAGLLGQFLAGVGILIASFAELFTSRDLTMTITSILGILAALSLLSLCWKQTQRNKARTFEMVAITVYLMAHLISQYRQWSAEPQLQNYLFQVLGSVFLMVACYHRARLELLGGKLRWYVFFNQGALLLCVYCLNTRLWAFYLAMGLWTWFDFITIIQSARLRPAPKPREETP